MLPGHKTQISDPFLALRDDPESARGKAFESEMSLSGKSIKKSSIYCHRPIITSLPVWELPMFTSPDCERLDSNESL